MNSNKTGHDTDNIIIHVQTDLKLVSVIEIKTKAAFHTMQYTPHKT